MHCTGLGNNNNNNNNIPPQQQEEEEEVEEWEVDDTDEPESQAVAVVKQQQWRYSLLNQVMEALGSTGHVRQALQLAKTTAAGATTSPVVGEVGG